MDRREYSRVDIGIEGSFYVHDKGNYVYEFVGTIENVSEGGIGVLVDTKEYEQITQLLNEGHNITFQAFDKEGFSIRQEEGIFDGKVEIVRKTISDGVISLGCKIEDNISEFQSYVENKKVVLYMESIKMKKSE